MDKFNTSTPLVEVKTKSGAVYYVLCGANELLIGSARGNDVEIAEAGVVPRLRLVISDQIEVVDPNPNVKQAYPLTELPLKIGNLELRLLSDTYAAPNQPRRRPRPRSFSEALALAMRARGQIVYHGAQRNWLATLRSLESQFIRTLFLLLFIGLIGFAIRFLMYQDASQWETIAAYQLIPAPTDTTTPMPTATPTMVQSTTSITPTATLTVTSTPTYIPTSTATPTETPTPYPNTTATMYPLAVEQQEFGTRIEPATVPINGFYWKVMDASWLRGVEVEGVQSIFVEILNENNQRATDQWILEIDVSGAIIKGCQSGEKPAQEPACDFPLYHDGPFVGIKVQGPLPSETVFGLGRDHRDPGQDGTTSYRIKFQRTQRTQ